MYIHRQFDTLIIDVDELAIPRGIHPRDTYMNFGKLRQLAITGREEHWYVPNFSSAQDQTPDLKHLS